MKRREFFSFATMLGGLFAGYGALLAIAGRFLYPSSSTPRRWMFVREVGRIKVGDSFVYQIPGGEKVSVTRRRNAGDEEDFIALSSTCPHLGCQVHWEGQNNRFFCPCHNGAFDPTGKGIAGPPGEAGQSLPHYPLKVEKGLLFLQIPISDIAGAADELRRV